MTDRNQTQPDLLDTFMQSLSSGQPNPPANLDPALASVAVMLSAELTPPDPSARFVRGLEQRLTSTVEAGQSHSATLPPSGESELSVTQTDAGWNMLDTPSRSRFSELARLAAAVLAIMLIGSVLVFLFSDREDDSRLAGAPEPTPAGSIGVPVSNDILISWDPEGGENYKLYIIDALGKNEPRELTPDQPGSGLMEHLGAWSPDGTRVAYLRSSSTSELMVINVDGTGTINVSEITGVSDVQRFSWSPDGEKLAFSSFAEEHRSIYVANADGSDLQTVISGEQINNDQVFEIAWAPSGDVLAFTVFETRFSVLFTVSIDGSDLLKQETSFNPIGLQWSPATTHLAYTAEEPRRGSRVYVLDPVSGDEQPLTSGPLTSGWATWSPDFNMLAFSIHDSGGSLDGTAIAQSDGSNRQMVTPFSGTLDWSPDGSRLVIITKTPSADAATGMTSAVHIMLTDGRILDSPLVDASIDGWPAWRPNSTPPEPEPIPGITPPAGITPVPEFTGTPDILTEPPHVSLAFQDQTQTHAAHSYCWPTSPDGEEECSMAARDVPPLPAIHVPAGATLSVDVEGDHAFTWLGVNAVRLVPYVEPSASGLNFDFPGEAIPFEQGPDGIIVTADVPEGDYSFEVSISMDVYPDHDGRANYAFRVIVGDPHDPPAASLSYQDQIQTWGSSDYCWPYVVVTNEVEVRCAESDRMPVPLPALHVPSGATLSFSLDGVDQFTILGAGSAPLIPHNQFPEPEVTWGTPVAGLPFEQGPDGSFIVADLPDGDYEFGVGIEMEVFPGHVGEASYAFRVVVGDRLPEASGLVPGRSWIGASVDEINASALKWTEANYAVGSAPTIRMSKAVTAQEAAEMQLHVGNPIDMPRDYHAVILQGDFTRLGGDVHGDDAFRFIAYVFDLEAGMPTTTITSRDGSAVKHALGDPSLPDPVDQPSLPPDIDHVPPAMLEVPEAAPDISSRELTQEQAAQFSEYPVWWLNGFWNNYTLRNITHTITTLAESEWDNVQLYYVGLNDGEEIQITSHDELTAWQLEAWQEHENFGGERITVGVFTGWLFITVPDSSVILDLALDGGHLRIDAPDRDTAIAVAESLIQVNSGVVSFD